MLEFASIVLQSLCDILFAVIPRKIQKPYEAKIVAHRGAPEGPIKENTLMAFRKCVEVGVWGIELDIRWTMDLVPIVIHDSDCSRIYNRPDIQISEIDSTELKSQISEIPTLEEVINEFSKKIHLMIEIKELPNPEQIEILKNLLYKLEPVRDYHLLTLQTDYFDDLTDFPKSCFVAVSELNQKKIWQHCLDHKWGGYATHYLLLSKKQIQLAKKKNLNLGTGYISSANCLKRELNRNIYWQFSNRPLYLQKILQDKF
ncbi:MAG: glycerophosphodiester phosphodiesterase [Bdellovibrionaceae bacterium]|nr:glycerophosphodiester phosphodiesterase [Pseudobdellovibrionaceae bacterium]